MVVALYGLVATVPVLEALEEGALVEGLINFIMEVMEVLTLEVAEVALVWAEELVEQAVQE